MNRRGFLKALVATTAVAVASATRLGQTIIDVVRDRLVLHGDGVTDDAGALQALMDGEEVFCNVTKTVLKSDGGGVVIPRGDYAISEGLTVRSHVVFDHSYIEALPEFPEGETMITVPGGTHDSSVSFNRLQGNMRSNGISYAQRLANEVEARRVQKIERVAGHHGTLVADIGEALRRL